MWIHKLNFSEISNFYQNFLGKYPVLWKNPNGQSEEDTSKMPQRYRVEKYLLYFVLFDSFVNILLIGRFYFHFEADLDISTGYQIIQKFFQKYKSHYDVQKISRKTEKFQDSLTHEKTICRSSGPYGRTKQIDTNCRVPEAGREVNVRSISSLTQKDPKGLSV